MLVDIMLKDKTGSNKTSIIDMCTGSGCIAVALAKNLPKANVSATDISSHSLEVAKRNAEHNLCKIHFIRDDILQPVAEYKSYDCIISNPPYVRNSEKQLMHKNVLQYEPSQALFVDDADPLIFYRSIVSFAQNHLTFGGKIYLEINEFLGEETKEYFEKSGFHEVQIIKDLQNKDRFLLAKK
jgi:release factor glutamine methyltransferase